MRLPHRVSPEGLDVALYGIPFDGGCSYRPGARFGPRHIREHSSLIRPWNSALDVEPFERLRVADCGDVDIVPISIEGTFAAIERTLDAAVEGGAAPLCAGGDHTITLAILRVLARRHGRLGLVHFDAHPDTWDRYFGLPYYHGSTFRRAVEEGLIDGARSIQVGIRGPLYGARRLCLPGRARLRGASDRGRSRRAAPSGWRNASPASRAAPSTARSTSMPWIRPTRRRPARPRWAG